MKNHNQDVVANRSVRVTLAHINDTHSYFEQTSLQLALQIDANKVIKPYVSAGGFARIATRIELLRHEAESRGEQCLFLHAGDCFQGTLYFSLFKGAANADLLSALKLDAMALGNHELDMGNEPVAQFVRRINFPFLAGNWNLDNESPSKRLKLGDYEGVKRYNSETQSAEFITKMIDGVPIAIFGLSIDKMSDIANPDPDTPFMPAIETAKNTVKQILSQGINNIILLSHLGYEGDLELAEQVDGIGLIIGGHSHRLQGDFSALGLKKDDDYGIKIKGTYVVQAGYHALSMGHCQIEFDANGNANLLKGKNELLIGRRMFLDSNLSEDTESEVRNYNDYNRAKSMIHSHPNVFVCKKHQAIQDILIEKYIPRVRKLQAEKISFTDQALRHVRIPDEKGGSQLAPLVAQSFYHSMNKLGKNVQFAIHNAGGVRISLNAGDISEADVAGRLLPFAVPIGAYELKGKDLALMLEGAINNATNNGVEGTGSGSYPYTHNLRFEYVETADLGQRVKNLMIYQQGVWRAVEAQTWYRGTSSAYTMKGKEGYDAVLNMKGEGEVSLMSMADCFIDLLKDSPDLFTQAKSRCS